MSKDMVGEAELGGRTPQRWAQAEFGRACFGDRRLRKRLCMVASDFLEHVGGSIPEACAGNWARLKGAYRFFGHAQVTPQNILASHRAATAERMRGHAVALAIQDTSVLDFSGRPRAAGLGPVGSSGHALGLFLHTTLAVAPGGAVLGVVDAQTWARPPGSQGKARRREKLPIQEKESRKWLESFAAAAELAQSLPKTLVVSVADREGDLYELLAAAAAHPHMGVLVRARAARRVLGREELSWAAVAAQAPAGTVAVDVPRRPGQPARRALLELRFQALTLAPPKRKAAAQPVLAWAVEARESAGPPGGSALLWRLLTTVPVHTLEEAAERARWYEARWQIEEFHRVLKSGCGAEQRQLESAARLEKALMLDLIVACRVLELSRAARAPEPPGVEKHLAQEEIAVVKALLNKGPQETLGLREAIRRIAQLGGFIGRKSDGEPGPMTLWRGLRRLEQLTVGFILGKTYG